MKKLLYFLIIGSLLTSCIPMQKVPKGSKMTDFFHFQKAQNYDASKWAVFVPGTGGLRVFKDTTAYYDVATRLNKDGISVLLVDNAAAYKASKRDVKEEEPAQIIWTLEQALLWAKQNKYIDANSEGSIVGWSRAGLGLIPLANNPKMLKEFNLNKMALYYPANGYEIQLKPEIPVLVMSGGKDRIVELDDIMKYMVAENVELKIYDDAYHGFDADIMEKGKYIRVIPFISKKIYFLKYNKEAAEDSFARLIEFLK